MKENIGCLVSLLIGIGLIIIAPMLYYVGGWITGHILKWLIGNTVVNGMNYIFNTTRFTTDMLPVACGTLGVIGSFFKSTNTTASNKN
jgi:hypothetical protein